MGIIGMLEVIESDFSRSLTEANIAEDTAQSEYEKFSQEYEVDKTTKESDVSYKTKEIASLKKRMDENNADLSGVQEELDAVLDSYEKLKPACIAKPETYEE